MVNVEPVRANDWPPPHSVPHALGAAVTNGVGSAAAPVARTSTTSLFMLLPLRLFLAVGWLRAATEKILSEKWWRGTEVRQFLADERVTALPFTRPLTTHVFDPAAPTVALAVMVTELLCGAALLTGRAIRTALYAGVALNVAFVVCGRVNPSAFYLVMEIVLLLAIADGAIGSTPRDPSRRTLVAAGAWVVAGLAFVPFITTMEPAGVIHDPAAMMSFLGVLLGAALAYRWVAAESTTQLRLSSSGAWSRRLTRWATANERVRR